MSQPAAALARRFSAAWRGLAICRLVALLLAGTVLLGGCQSGASVESHRVHGRVIDVQARSIAQAASVTVRADDGRELTFRVDPSVEVTPGHLREHMALGEPVVVHYRVVADGLLAIAIDDG